MPQAVENLQHVGHNSSSVRPLSKLSLDLGPILLVSHAQKYFRIEDHSFKNWDPRLQGRGKVVTHRKLVDFSILNLWAAAVLASRSCLCGAMNYSGAGHIDR
jgi:hypothetical protein